MSDPFGGIDNFLKDLLIGFGLDSTFVAVILKLTAAVVLGGLAGATAIVLIWVERKLVARIQDRLGPNRVGPFGLLQPIADAIKVLLKEDIVPAKADKFIHLLAPIVAFAPALMIFAVIPFQSGALLADLNIGILY
ncbi:MAG: complex I subunit 1 family protein, partial [Chloroflexota bacterium]